MRRNILAVATSILLTFTSTALLATETLTIEQVYAQKDKLAGKQVEVMGKVVKVNNGIMGRNFLHITDGTGKEGTNDLTITSDDTAEVGDKISASGEVVINRDFGAGYSYPLLLEKVHISKAK